MIYTVITIGPSDNTDDFDDEPVTLNPIFNDESGLLDRVEFDPDAIAQEWFPLFPPAPDLIYIRPDWPAIGSPDFAEQLRSWHDNHNPPLVTDAGDPCEQCGLPCDGSRCPPAEDLN